MVTLREGLGEGFGFSVTAGGDDLGEALGAVRGRVWSCVLTLRRGSVLGGGTVTVRPGVVTVSEANVVVVVVVVC